MQRRFAAIAKTLFLGSVCVNWPQGYNCFSMVIAVQSFAKINLGLRIGALRPDGFHELRTVYQTIALQDMVRVSVAGGSGIEIRCDDPRVPKDSNNTCFGMVERAMQALKARGRVIVEIEKRLPVQGGLGGASGNAVAALLALELALRKKLAGAERLRIAAEVGSDLPLFLIGGTVLGVGRGEEVYPLPDLPAAPCAIAMPEIAVSTPKAFADWDALKPSLLCHSEPATAGEEPDVGRQHERSRGKQASRLRRMTEFLNESKESPSNRSKLTPLIHSDRMIEFSREISAWLSAEPGRSGRRRSGVSAKGGGRAETLQLDLVRTGIENDFEKVVFPQYPELHEVKSVLERAGAQYASLSGSGSAIYGLFESREKAAAAAKKLIKDGIPAVVTNTLTRRQYWKQLLATGS
jgi:4-diphosphocytidyl-2-C-methyl-D-erythritol kinase